MKIEIAGEKFDFQIKKFENSGDNVWFILSGELGSVTAEYMQVGNLKPFFNLNYHTKKPLNEYVKISKDSCEFIGCPCYCDGRFINKHINDVDILDTLKKEYENIKCRLSTT